MSRSLSALSDVARCGVLVGARAAHSCVTQGMRECDGIVDVENIKIAI